MTLQGTKNIQMAQVQRLLTDKLQATSRNMRILQDSCTQHLPAVTREAIYTTCSDMGYDNSPLGNAKFDDEEGPRSEELDPGEEGSYSVPLTVSAPPKDIASVRSKLNRNSKIGTVGYNDDDDDF